MKHHSATRRRNGAWWPFEKATMRPGVRRPRVLLAEDDDDIRSVIAAILRWDGYEVVEASNGAELLERVGDLLLAAEKGDAPTADLIVSDVRMPGFSGLTVLAGLREADDKTPFVLITAYADDDTLDKARRAGVDAVFRKPFDVDDLRTAVINMAPIAR